MRGRRDFLGLLALWTLAIAPQVLAASPVSSALHGPYDTARPEPRPVWVFFEDKGLEPGTELDAAILEAERRLSPRALRRRAKVRSGPLTDVRDAPVCRAYMQAVLATGARHRSTTGWLNAVSVEADPVQIARIEALPFVRKVQPLAGRWRDEPSVEPAPMPKATGASRYLLDYGESLCQVEPMQVPELHDQGFTGAGVLVCVLDTGFWRAHDCLVGVDVAAEWDFINDDSVTANEPGDPDTQHGHGTRILSLIAGYEPGHCIGVAYGASYALAKTEDISGETPADEDRWVEAIEWADSLGADVVTSSLCYYLWYTYADMDGNTAVTTIAGDLAVANGMVVLNAAGNAGASWWHYIMPAADGDSVLGIGAVDTFGVITDFSSRGPSYDGRIKPDLVAVGEGNWVAKAFATSGYVRDSGTSCSCPLVAGVCALLLESHPDWKPMELAEALKMTATHAVSPDTLYGWGLVQAVAANAYVPTGVADGRTPGAWAPRALTSCPNPFSNRTVLSLLVPEHAVGPAALTIFDVRGRLVRTLVGTRPSADRLEYRWDGMDRSGQEVSPGVYFARTTIRGAPVRGRLIRIR